MPLPERTYRHVDTSRSPTTIASVEQFLRGSPSYSPTSSSSPSSPYFERLKQHDLEDDHSLYQKKSVLTKVKEKARKFRNSLSKRRMDDDNVTPSWGVSLEDDEYQARETEEEDAEYLGAPMYESELAPEGYKENARQHPRANPVISEKHVLHNNVKLGVAQEREKSLKCTSTSQVPPPSNAPLSVSAKIQPQLPSSSLDAKSTSTTDQPKPLSPSLSTANATQNTAHASLKDYITNKSVSQPDHQVTSETTTPTSRTTSSNAGVIDKVRGAVNSLLGNEEPSQQYGVNTPTRTSSQTQQVDQEENRGRILQAN